MTHLRSLEIKSFRNVRPTKLSCRPGLNVVLGKNAAGKTTLLNLLASSLEPFPPAGDERDVEFAMMNRGDTLTRRLLQSAVKSFPDVSGAPLASNGNIHVREEFELSHRSALHPKLNVKASEGWLNIEGQEPVRATGPSGFVSLYEHLNSASHLGARTLMGFLEPSPCRLDESLEYFQSLVAFEAARTPTGVSFSLEKGQPKSFHTLFNQPLHLDQSGFRASPSFATNAARVMGYDGADVLFDVESKTTGAGVETTLRNLRFVFRSGSDTFSHSSLSYGEKRLLAFFALSDAAYHVMIVDELVNGLHHEWIKACLVEIGPRQAFLTSQNPLLLDYLEFESPEDVRDGFILCERVRQSENGFAELVWRNPNEEEASEFFAAYQTGVQRVSDILISKGFW